MLPVCLGQLALWAVACRAAVSRRSEDAWPYRGNPGNPSCMPAQVNTDMTVELPCEDAARLAGKLEAQAELGPLRMLYDAAEVVEACGGSHMEVHLDCRQHGTESLLLPGLAPHQGPAICVKLPGAQKAAASIHLRSGDCTRLPALGLVHACLD